MTSIEKVCSQFFTDLYRQYIRYSPLHRGLVCKECTGGFAQNVFSNEPAAMDHVLSHIKTVIEETKEVLVCRK